jgi:uncharacterized protein
MGVSIDGPAFIHDRHRRDREGRGTHERAIQGVRLLQKHQIDFHVIAVVTQDALNYPDKIFDFFLDLGVRRLGFNVEELEGVHRVSTLVESGVETRVRDFWKRLYERQAQAGGAIQIREFVRAWRVISGGPAEMTTETAMQSNSQTAPFGIVSADWQGNISTFSPELLGVRGPDYGDFIFGHIDTGGLLELRNSEKFDRIAADIEAGVKLCESGCQYFNVCGGGAPSNKYFENGSFASAETMYCRTTIQMPIDIVLADMEKGLGLYSTHTTGQ